MQDESSLFSQAPLRPSLTEAARLTSLEAHLPILNAPSERVRRLTEKNSVSPTLGLYGLFFSRKKPQTPDFH